MTRRVSLYSEVHKGLRRQLFTLLLDCGSRDPEHESEVADLVTRLRDLRSVLDEHAQHEERWVEPILKELRPELADELHSEHRALDEQLHRVSEAFEAWAKAAPQHRAVAGAVSYDDLAAFVGPYLTHMSREENEAMPVIQAAMSDEKILEVSANLRASIPPPRMADYLSFMLPAMNVLERTAMFSGLKAAAPPEVLQGMCALASNVLANDDWSALRARAEV